MIQIKPAATLPIAAGDGVREKAAMFELKGSPRDCAGRRGGGGCELCAARPFSVCASVPDADLARLDALAETVTLEAGQALVRQGDLVRDVYNLTSGSARVCRLLDDGRRQITGFLFAGDFIGLEAGETYAASVEALEPATACRFRKSAFRALMAECPALETALLDRASHELAAAREQVVLLGAKRAVERVASFLLSLPDADPLRPAPSGVIRLPMTRGEIADYLGLTLETVSRSLTQLKRTGAIRQISLAELRIERPDALAEAAGAR